LAVAGCSVGEEEKPKPVTGAPKQVAETVQALDSATRSRDFAEVCSELLTAEARRRAGGKDCESLLRSATSDLRRPRIELRSIVVKADKATARVRTHAKGQAPIDETIELVREGGEYRIAALAD
jgi:hypothetical protein